jgi:hypothetical protein
LEADLSVVLSDVTMEAKHVKVWLSKVQAELETPSSSGDDNTAAVVVASTLLRSATASVGEVGFQKPHPRSTTLTTFGPRTTSVSRRNLRCTGANKNANTAHVM